METGADGVTRGRVVADLSHAIHDGLPAYPGLPAARVGLHRDHVSSRPHYDGRAEFAIGRFEMVGNTGTYLDAPFHRFRQGADVAGLSLARLVDLPTVVVDAREEAAAGRRLDLVLPPGSLAGSAVLVRTDRSLRWGSEAYWQPGPYLGEVTLDQLVHHRPAVVGVDFPNVDDPDDLSRPAHTRLLGEGIAIVEHLRDLARLPSEARSSFVPLAVVGAPSMPIRAFATWQETRGR
jgi:kynurenine formamidase